MHLGGIEIGVAGYYTFELNGKPVFEVPSKNLITDFGWNRIANLGQTNLNGTVLQLGTSNTPPAVTDTALGAFVAQRGGPANGTVGTGTDVIGAYTYTRASYAFAQGDVVGNIAEVGWKINSADVSISSRSLVKDGLGNPAIITVTSIDQLTVTYELRYYRDPLDVTSSVTVAGVPTTWILRTSTAVSGTSSDLGRIGGLYPSKMDINHFGTGFVLGAPNSAPSGGGGGLAVSQQNVVGLVVTVNPTTIVVTLTSPTVAVGSGNSSGGVYGITFFFRDASLQTLGGYGNLKASFSPPIPKDNTKTVNYSFSFTFNRL